LPLVNDNLHGMLTLFNLQFRFDTEQAPNYVCF
jgi:hypothetical protein